MALRVGASKDCYYECCSIFIESRSAARQLQQQPHLERPLLHSLSYIPDAGDLLLLVVEPQFDQKTLQFEHHSQQFPQFSQLLPSRQLEPLGSYAAA